MFYAFPGSNDAEDYAQSVAFCLANDINPKAVVYGSTFEVTDEQWVIIREFELTRSGTRVWHDACCGSTHYAKRHNRYELQVKPETFGFEPLRTADGSVAP